MIFIKFFWIRGKANINYWSKKIQLFIGREYATVVVQIFFLSALLAPPYPTKQQASTAVAERDLGARRQLATGMLLGWHHDRMRASEPLPVNDLLSPLASSRFATTISPWGSHEIRQDHHLRTHQICCF